MLSFLWGSARDAVGGGSAAATFLKSRDLHTSVSRSSVKRLFRVTLNKQQQSCCEPETSDPTRLKAGTSAGFWGSGVLGFRGFGVLGVWGLGVLGFWGLGFRVANLTHPSLKPLNMILQEPRNSQAHSWAYCLYLRKHRVSKQPSNLEP